MSTHHHEGAHPFYGGAHPFLGARTHSWKMLPCSWATPFPVPLLWKKRLRTHRQWSGVGPCMSSSELPYLLLCSWRLPYAHSPPCGRSDWGLTDSFPVVEQLELLIFVKIFEFYLVTHGPWTRQSHDMDIFAMLLNWICMQRVDMLWFFLKFEWHCDMKYKYKYVNVICKITC